MKLRIRSLETQETQRIEVTVPCSLRRLKELISLGFSSSSSPSSPLPIDSIRLSLNRKDEIQSSSPDEDTLQSLGITSGDLVFFTINPNSFSSQTIITNSLQGPTPNSIIKPQQNPGTASCNLKSDASTNSHQGPTPTSIIKPQQNPGTTSCNLKSDASLSVEACNQPESSNLDGQPEEVVEDKMEVDGENDEGYIQDAVRSSFYAPSFLKKVFSAELDSVGGENHKLLIVAIHAVLLESGFVGYDMDLKNEVKGFQLKSDQPRNMFLMSLFYTIPGIIGHVYPSSEHQKGVVVLKFQMTGNVVTVYGSLSCASTRTHSLRLNEEYLVPFLNVVWANCGLCEKIPTKDGTSFTSPETEVFNFWRKVKDELALPLLIDLCDRAGLVLPACFMRLPIDLKLKIMESLPGEDIAKVSCVCSELRYLGSNDDLWKVKFVEQFDNAAGSLDEKGVWKSKFARRWLGKKKRMDIASAFRHPRRTTFRPIIRMPPRPRIIGGDDDIWPPRRGIIGGDHDIWPENFRPFRQIGLPSNRRSHIPPCNWNGNA